MASPEETDSARKSLLVLATCAAGSAAAPAARMAPDPPTVYVALWKDTEDYILPASDDAALRVATLLHEEGASRAPVPSLEWRA